MKHLFAIALSGFGLLLGSALPGSAQATTPCRNECQNAYNYCVLSGESTAVCSAQRQQCYSECTNPFAAAAPRDGVDAAANALQRTFVRNAQRRSIPLPKAG